MFDTHAHLTNSSFSNDLPAVLGRAQSAGLNSVLVVSETLVDAHSVLSLCTTSPYLHPALGLHPAHVTTLSPSTLSTHLSSLNTLFHSHPVAAIGEVGLDYTPQVLSLAADPSTARNQQQSTFAHFLCLSRELDLPITAHSRGAGRHALDVVNDATLYGPVRVVMHAFDGRAVYAERALDRIKDGLYFSVPPCVVRSPQLAKLVKRLPLERLLLESDAPALGVVAGARSEPAQVLRAVDMIAGLKGIDSERVKAVIANNEHVMFPKLLRGQRIEEEGELSRSSLCECVAERIP